MSFAAYEEWMKESVPELEVDYYMNLMKLKLVVIPADIPLEINSHVEQWMTYFTVSKGSGAMRRWLGEIW
ncbi:MAG: hypothetical protein MZV64_08290 [Ignavibacteriales bacterium]|nr:hypothetical protein [Ignavibacteriales bacterium]